MLEILGKACDIGEGRDAILTMIYYVKLVLRILQIAVPIGLILFGRLLLLVMKRK